MDLKINSNLSVFKGTTEKINEDTKEITQEKPKTSKNSALGLIALGAIAIGGIYYLKGKGKGSNEEANKVIEDGKESIEKAVDNAKEIVKNKAPEVSEKIDSAKKTIENIVEKEVKKTTEKFFEDGKTIKQKIEYNEKTGEQKKITLFNQSGKIEAVSEFGENNSIKTTRYDADGKTKALEESIPGDLKITYFKEDGTVDHVWNMPKSK